MKDILENLTPELAISLASLSSSIHRLPHYDTYSYLGKKYQYKGFFLIADKKYRKAQFKTNFHVVLIKASKEMKKMGQLDRFLAINYINRNSFQLFNINQDNSITEVTLFQDNLFLMYSSLSKKIKDKDKDKEKIQHSNISILLS